jgi:hypothetical protein
MANNDRLTREWQQKVSIVLKLHDTMQRLIQEKNWAELDKLYSGITIDNGMGTVSFSDSAAVNAWLTSHYSPLMNEININAYANLFKKFGKMSLINQKKGGKRSTRRHHSRRQRTRRQKK